MNCLREKMLVTIEIKSMEDLKSNIFVVFDMATYSLDIIQYL